MSLQYSCFISYRHRPGDIYTDTIENLYRALKDELAFWFDEDVFRDTDRIKGGDFFTKELARALCESCCMIMVFIPTYFDMRYTYCAREYQAMVKLERKRLKLIGKEKAKGHGLIIPIICRGSQYFPAEIREKRQWYDFESFLLESRLQEAEARVRIRDIAQYVRARFEDFQNLSIDPCEDCANFTFPSEKSVLQWLKRLNTPRPQGLPLREAPA